MIRLLSKADTHLRSRIDENQIPRNDIKRSVNFDGSLSPQSDRLTVGVFIVDGGEGRRDFRRARVQGLINELA